MESGASIIIPYFLPLPSLFNSTISDIEDYLRTQYVKLQEAGYIIISSKPYPEKGFVFLEIRKGDG